MDQHDSTKGGSHTNGMNGKNHEEPKFRPGRVFITRAALMDLEFQDHFNALCRHLCGDWGDICKDDWESNDEAIADGFRLFSSYTDRNGVKFWIITEADRSMTTILLPEDY